MRRAFFGKHGRLFVIALTVVSLVIGGVAWAYFTSTGSGTGAASIGSLAAPTHVTGTPSGSVVGVSWTGVSDPGAGTFGYYVVRTPSPTGTAVNVCGSSPTSLLSATPASCNDTSVPDGTYSYTVIAVYNSFSTNGVPSGPVHVNATPPTASAPGVSASVRSGIWVNGENVTLTDSPSSNGGSGVASVTYYYCSATAAPCTNSNWVSIGTSSSGGSWSVVWPKGDLPADGAYDIVATAANKALLTSAISAATEFGVDTTPPSVTTPIVNGQS